MSTRRFIVLGHQYSGRDVILQHYILIVSRTEKQGPQSQWFLHSLVPFVLQRKVPFHAWDHYL